MGLQRYEKFGNYMQDDRCFCCFCHHRTLLDQSGGSVPGKVAVETVQICGAPGREVHTESGISLDIDAYEPFCRRPVDNAVVYGGIQQIEFRFVRPAVCNDVLQVIEPAVIITEIPLYPAPWLLKICLHISARGESPEQSTRVTVAD